TGVSPSRQASCAQIVRLYIVPTLGHRRLSALSTLEIQGLVSRHVAAGLAPSTIKVIHSTFRTALGRAVTWRLVSRNPAVGVTVPRVITRPPAAWSAEQVRVFLAATADHPLHPLWRLSLDTGMRPGEAVVVRWGDLDLDRGVLTVARTMTRDARFRPVVGETTKTGAARRVTLTPETVACLRAHRSVAGTIDRAAYVFARPDGRPVAPRSVGTAFARSIASTDLPAIRLHDLRHTNITLLIAAGVPVTVIAERVGHARVSMTLDTYAHVLAGMRDDAARALSALFTPPRDPDVTTDDADRSKSAPA
ncbi:MAG: site-specific integrase, partial [Chloroflexota bacterium]|nr:site-specific integrase [Chloroflexota bacterium]